MCAGLKLTGRRWASVGFASSRQSSVAHLSFCSPEAADACYATRFLASTLRAAPPAQNYAIYQLFLLRSLLPLPAAAPLSAKHGVGSGVVVDGCWCVCGCCQQYVLVHVRGAPLICHLLPPHSCTSFQRRCVELTDLYNLVFNDWRALADELA